jgi:hypothetical protein
MNNKDTNRLAMVTTTRDYLGTNSAIWSPMAPFGVAVTDLTNKLTEIDAMAQKHDSPSGAAADKADARDDLEDILFLACRALLVLAHGANDNELAELCRLSPSALGELDELALATRAANVLAAANARKTELATLQVTQANLDEFTQRIAAFNEMRSGPREATATHRVHTQSLRRLIQDAVDILRNRIDPMVDLFSRSDPDFVAGYKAARVIVDRAATHASAKAPRDETPK